MNEKDKLLEKPTKIAVFSYASMVLISFSRLIYDLINKRVYEHVIFLIISSILLIVKMLLSYRNKLLY